MKKLFLTILAVILLAAACTSPAPTQPAAESPRPETSAPPSAEAASATPAGKSSRPISPTETFAPSPTPKADFVYQQNARLGRGVNLGNALEAPNEGEWGVTLQEEYFKAIKDAGFQHVRIPARFSNHASAQAPYQLDEQFMARVDWAIDQAQQQGLMAIIDMHHYLEIFENPPAHKERFVAIWKQIAERYREAPDAVIFELLNEPNTNLDAPQWNELLAQTIQAIRQSNPNRTIIVGPAGWYSISQLETLSLPEEERNLIVSVHFYSPFQFTHQGAEWVDNSEPWLGTQWAGDYTERSLLGRELRSAALWGKANNRPIYLGEFGAYNKAEMESRARWTNFVARKAEELGMSWAYWEWCAGFGVYDPEAKAFRQPLLEALIPPRTNTEIK